MRLINADKLIERINRLPKTGMYRFVSVRAVFDAILKETTIEPEPSAQPEREKGEWIWCGDRHGCSECDEFALCDAYDVLETGEHQEDLSDFCPHCGADMRQSNAD